VIAVQHHPEPEGDAYVILVGRMHRLRDRAFELGKEYDKAVAEGREREAIVLINDASKVLLELVEIETQMTEGMHGKTSETE
jgi:hypothetical protein